MAAVTPVGPSMFSVAARQARENGKALSADVGTGFGSGFGDTPSDAAPIVPANGGLARRVPGAQRPDAAIAHRAAEPEEPAARTTPEDVYSFLSNFQSGVARGRADATDNDHTSFEEDGR